MSLHTHNKKKEYLHGEHLAGQGKLVSKLSARPGAAGKQHNSKAMLSAPGTITKPIPWEISQAFVIGRPRK